MDVVLQNFRRSFEPFTHFFHSLSLNLPMTMEELYGWADRYSTLEDNIRPATQTVMITRNRLRATSQWGRSRLSPRKVRAKTERDPVISHIKRGRLCSSPPRTSHTRGSTPHSRLTGFQVACTDLDGSLSEKPICAVQLS